MPRILYGIGASTVPGSGRSRCYAGGAIKRFPFSTSSFSLSPPGARGVRGTCGRRWPGRRSQPTSPASLSIALANITRDAVCARACATVPTSARARGTLSGRKLPLIKATLSRFALSFSFSKAPLLGCSLPGSCLFVFPRDSLLQPLSSSLPPPQR